MQRVYQHTYSNNLLWKTPVDILYTNCLPAQKELMSLKTDKLFDCKSLHSVHHLIIYLIFDALYVGVAVTLLCRKIWVTDGLIHGIILLHSNNLVNSNINQHIQWLLKHDNNDK